MKNSFTKVWDEKIRPKFPEFPVVPAFFVFFFWLSTAKLSQYIFFNLHTSPALIWPPTGIALAAIILYGYRMWIPIICAAFLGSWTSPANLNMAVIIGATVGQTAAPLFGAYLLRRFGFSNSFKKNTDVIKFFGMAILASTVAPTVIVTVQLLTHTLPASIFVSWSRSWAGRFLSILLVTPLIITWFPWKRVSFARKKITEPLITFGLLLVVTYIVFWTDFAESISFLLILALFGILFWISMRAGSRAMTLSLFMLAVMGVAGSIFIPHANRPLNQQMLLIELFAILITPIFLAFSALMHERRESVLRLEANMRKLEDAMQKLNKEDRSKNEFIAILAHELRNPLAPVLSTLELLKLQNQSPEALKMIEGAEAQTHAMKRLLDDLLDVARVVQKEFKLNKQVIDLHTAIHNCIYSTENFMRSREHTLTVSVPPKGAVYLEVDQVRFEQVIVNILNNAGKYTKPGGVINLSCAVKNGNLEVRVEDNGMGISPENLKHIFEPFRQIEPKPQAGTGLGVGLSISRQLVEMHGGTIRAESEGPGKGSVFILTFPLIENLQPVEADARPVRELKISQAIKVLVVDDNKPAAEGLEKLLKIKGFKTSLAYDEESAIVEAKNFDPHVILLDIGLPDMDGYEVARKLRSDNFSATIIALSGYGQGEDKLKAKEAGFDHYLTKPVSISHLEGVLHDFTHSPKMENEEANLKVITNPAF